MNVFARWIITMAVFLPCFGTSAVADEFHYNNLLIGDRAAGMGGAYTALSDDSAGLFYNPAGIAYASESYSASANTFNSQTKKYKNALDGKTFERQSSALLANFFGVIKPVGKYKFGFSYAVPDSVSEDQDQAFDLSNGGRKIINLSNKDNTINLGPSFAMELIDDLAVGITLYAHKRETELILNQFEESADKQRYRWTSQYSEVNEWGMRPVIGIAWSPLDKLSLGLSLSKTVLFESSAVGLSTCSVSTTLDCNNDNNDPTPTADLLLAPGSIEPITAKKIYPVRVAVGAAYFASSSLLFSGDLTYYTAVADPNFGDKIAVVNVALGTEYYLTKKWAVRAGLFTNMANTPIIKEGVESNFEEHINLYGGSMSITNFSGNTSVTLGGSASYGIGKSQIAGGTSVQDASTLGWMIFLSSAH